MTPSARIGSSLSLIRAIWGHLTKRKSHTRRAIRNGPFPYLSDAATAKYEALAWHSSQRVEQLHREPPVPSCQKVLLLDGVFPGEACVPATPSVPTVS